MMTMPAKRQETPLPKTIEDVLMRGDLSALSEQQRVEYYNRVCQSVGLNPLTRPFDYLTLNGKLQLYARRDAADQLRKLHGINIEIVSQDFAHDLLTVHVRAKDNEGRTDEDFGVVTMGENLKGEFRANMIMKAVTKAKRRVTLSICGLGFLDETEVEDIPGQQKFREPESGPQPTRTRDQWKTYGLELIEAVGTLSEMSEKKNLIEASAPQLKLLETEEPEVHERLIDRLNKELKP